MFTKVREESKLLPFWTVAQSELLCLLHLRTLQSLETLYFLPHPLLQHVESSADSVTFLGNACMHETTPSVTGSSCTREEGRIRSESRRRGTGREDEKATIIDGIFKAYQHFNLNKERNDRFLLHSYQKMNWNFHAVFLVLLPVVLAIEWPPSAEICRDVVCKKPRGSWCTSQVKKGKEKAVCACPEDCPEVYQPVCSVYGRQFDNLCKLHMYTCQKEKTIPMAYEGECIASQKKCKREEYEQFPVRLLDWFMHLHQIDEFGRLDPNTNIKQVTSEERVMYATWKFNLLDEKNDGYLDKRDLLNFRYALMPLEHCANDFFKSCANKKKKISLEGWIQCLKVYDAEEYPEEGAEFGGFFEEEEEDVEDDIDDIDDIFEDEE